MYEKETLQQMEAFEFYYVSGKDRSQEKVAEEYKISLRTVARWSSDFGWQDRLILRDKANGEKLAAAIDTVIVNEKSKLINIAKASIARYVEALKETRTLYDKDGRAILIPKVAITNPMQFIELAKLYLLLLGETGEEQVNIRIEDARYDDRDDQDTPVAIGSNSQN